MVIDSQRHNCKDHFLPIKTFQISPVYNCIIRKSYWPRISSGEGGLVRPTCSVALADPVFLAMTATVQAMIVFIRTCGH